MTWLTQWFPKLIKPGVQLCPTAIQSQLASQALNQLFKAHCQQGDFDFLAGRWLAIEVTDLARAWQFSFDQTTERLLCRMASDVADVTIAGEFNAFALLASQLVDPDTLFFKRQLVILGDTELGLAVKNLLDTVELTSLPTLLAQPVVFYGKQLSTQL